MILFDADMLEVKEQNNLGGVSKSLERFLQTAVRREVCRLELHDEVAPLHVKRCTCASNGNCPSHIGEPAPPSPPPPPVIKKIRPRSTGSSIARSHIVHSELSSKDQDELKLSLSSLNTESEQPSEADAAAREEMFARWLREKEEARRRLSRERALLEQAILAEKQRKMELEQRNFESWLTLKRNEERKKKENAVRQKEERKKIEVKVKEKKKLENELSYALWLKRAEEKKLNEQLRVETEKVHEAEKRRQRLEMNAAAYERWLSEARHKPRPLPLNKGLESLRASVSVSYVNPNPWQPNVKPATQ